MRYWNCSKTESVKKIHELFNLEDDFSYEQQIVRSPKYAELKTEE